MVLSWVPAVVAELARAADAEEVPAGIETVSALSRTVILIAGVLVVLILLPLLFLVYRRVFAAVRAGEAETPKDQAPEAEKEEGRGNYAAAAGLYDLRGEKMKAAECYEKGKDLARAAECYEAAGSLERAAQLHVRSGGSLKAAGIFMQTKNYIEAAKIFRNKGDHLRAAQALDLFGNRVAAAREYSAAGQHARAARLLEEEKMYAEAAAAYLPLLGGAEVTAANCDRYGIYAALLTLAGQRAQAVAIYRKILAVKPEHRKAEAGLRALLPREEAPPPAAGKDVVPAPSAAGTAAPPVPAISERAVEELALEIDADYAAPAIDPLQRVFTLRSMIRAGRMEPRYSMRLWIQVMRALAERHRANIVFGCLTPDSIFIDMQNNVRIEKPKSRRPEYLAPEIQAGLPPDRQSDIYSMGVVLYELVTGAVDHLGKKRPAELYADVPPWLDELIQHCTEKNLTKRFRGTEEISAALLKLKSAVQE